MRLSAAPTRAGGDVSPSTLNSYVEEGLKAGNGLVVLLFLLFTPD